MLVLMLEWASENEHEQQQEQEQEQANTAIGKSSGSI
jgi:hypothetical protein